MAKSPKVSIIVITYNQSNYIKQALDGILMQKTNFGVEVIVADDASPDNTKDIIKSYVSKHADTLKPILRSKNIGAWNNFVGALKVATGQYIALCEGDDYWTDSNKLQKQVDFMEANPSCAVLFHPVSVVYEDSSRPDEVFPQKIPELSVKNLLKENFIQTNSVMYRRQNNYDDISHDVMPGDWYLHLYHAQFGKICSVDGAMSVYRRHKDGVWYDSSTNRYAFWEKYGEAHLSLCRELLALYGDKHDLSEIIYSRASSFINDIAHSSDGSDLHLLQMIVSKYPEFIAVNIYNNQNNIKTKEEEVVKLVKSAKDKDIQIDRLSKAISEKDAQIVEIKSSKVWRARNKIVKIAGKKAI